jgi:hypothetical protein
MKKMISFAIFVGALTMSGAAFAGNSGTGAEYGTQPGFAVSSEASQNKNCNGAASGHGSFGYFGKDNNLGIKSDPTDPGANGQQTGLNNSGVCGNRPD